MTEMNQNENIKRLKRIILKASFNAKEGHVASAFSILDILWILYDKILDLDPIFSGSINRDRFILSKGHASLALYSVLADKGFFSTQELEENFCKSTSFLGGHPNSLKIPGVEASTGSLGHGLPFAIGIAMGFKIKNIQNRVYIVVGDGECNEGSIWESFLLASHHKLNNLTCIVDYNHSGDRSLSLNDISSKIKSFDWELIVIDGHNHDQIYRALSLRNNKGPIAIVANTIKGKGCSTMENSPAWHHRAPNNDELKTFLAELS